MNNSIYAEIFLRKSLSYIYKLLIIIVFIIIIISIFILNMNYKSTINTTAKVVLVDNTYYTMIAIKDENINYIINNNYLKHNNKDIYYKVSEITEEYYQDNYRILYLKTKLDKKYKINNLNIDVKFDKENKKIINYILDYIKER